MFLRIHRQFDRQNGMTIMFTLFLLTGCSRDECADPGSTWCEGDVEHECINDGSHIGNSDPPNELLSHNCADYGATCIEETYEGEDFGSCGYTEEECPDTTSHLCIGDYIGFCDHVATFPVAEDNTMASSLECVEQGWGCVEVVSENGHTSATCSYITEHCESGDDSYCDDGEFGNNVVRCENTVWTPYQCDATEPCCVEVSGAVNCVDIEDHDEMCTN